jgi:tRNA (cytidine/uridine-2'-O-)-methyltransferase
VGKATHERRGPTVTFRVGTRAFRALCQPYGPAPRRVPPEVFTLASERTRLNVTAAAPVRIALYQPDIAPNTGTILRLCACLGLEAHIIEPAGFPASDRAFRRAGMDYLDHVALTRHASWQAFERWRTERQARLVVLSVHASCRYLDYRFRSADVLLFGRETAGLPPHVHAAADARLLIPMRQDLRSLNVAVAAGIVAGEALRQLDSFPAAAQ